jgi:lipooligosaccharide transport system permease protein
MIRLWNALFGNVSRRAWRVWQRDADVYRTTWLINFLPPLLEPVLYIVAFGIGMGSLIGVVVYQDRELRYLNFMIPGVIAVAIMFWAYFETTYSSFVRMYYQRTFDAILATPLLVEDVIAGEWLWGASKSVLAAAIMLGITGAFGLVTLPQGLLVLPVALAGGLLFSALGLITSAISPRIETFNLPIFVLIFPMFLFSGTFFPIDVLPRWAMNIALVLPLTHVSYLVRGACLGQAPSIWVWSILYLLGATVVTTGAAMYLMRRRLIR